MTWGIGDLNQTSAVEEEPCPSAVGSMSPGAVDLGVLRFGPAAASQVVRSRGERGGQGGSF